MREPRQNEIQRSNSFCIYTMFDPPPIPSTPPLSLFKNRNGTVTVKIWLLCILYCFSPDLLGKENPVVKYTLKCLKCLFWCLEKFMKFINKNAYIMVRINVIFQRWPHYLKKKKKKYLGEKEAFRIAITINIYIYIYRDFFSLCI